MHYFKFRRRTQTCYRSRKGCSRCFSVASIYSELCLSILSDIWMQSCSPLYISFSGALKTITPLLSYIWSSSELKNGLETLWFVIRGGRRACTYKKSQQEKRINTDTCVYVSKQALFFLQTLRATYLQLNTSAVSGDNGRLIYHFVCSETEYSFYVLWYSEEGYIEWKRAFCYSWVRVDLESSKKLQWKFDGHVNFRVQWEQIWYSEKQKLLRGGSEVQIDRSLDQASVLSLNVRNQ